MYGELGGGVGVGILGCFVFENEILIVLVII